jgi:predicted hydrocarbon binding protein
VLVLSKKKKKKKEENLYTLARLHLDAMELKKELISLRIFLANYHTEIEKTFGTNTVKAILNRMGQKPAEIVADQILQKYDKTLQEPFELPSAAFSLFENTITKLFDAEVITVTEDNLKEQTIIKIKNICAFRQVIKSRKELEYGGSLCEFTQGYFETALKKLTGMSVEYNLVERETTDDHCVIEIVFSK